MTANHVRTVRRAAMLGAAIALVGLNLGRLWFGLIRRRRRRPAIQPHTLSDAVLREIGLDQPAIARADVEPDRLSRTPRHI